MVEYQLLKLRVAGSSPVGRSIKKPLLRGFLYEIKSGGHRNQRDRSLDYEFVIKGPVPLISLISISIAIYTAFFSVVVSFLLSVFFSGFPSEEGFFVSSSFVSFATEEDFLDALLSVT